jgi:hypothetical protein
VTSAQVLLGHERIVPGGDHLEGIPSGCCKRRPAYEGNLFPKREGYSEGFI